MAGQPQSRLFQDALGPRDAEAEQQPRERLRASYASVRARAAVLAQEIGTSLPSFPVHDQSHSDALWDLAEQIGGPKIELNGAEAYVLGVAFLIHDLGLAAASYPAGRDSLRADPLWSDTVIQLLRRQLGRRPTEAEWEDPSPEIVQEAEAQVLRELHAAHAEDLARISWDGAHGERLWLVEDSDLREAYGTLIGRLAHSHWWTVDRLGIEFPVEIGATPAVPPDWKVDPLKLACLLRAADAAHLDASRAPQFLRALRRPSGLAAEHWTFQERLNRPLLRNGRLAYASSSPFAADDAQAWWLCLEMLSEVDRWLRETDALLADLGRPRFAARGVAAVDDPKRFAQLVQTDGWAPVDVSLHVSSVAELVKRLGGRQLYGDDLHAPLRELIQNAADAVRLRRTMQSRSPEWGEVNVTLSAEDDGWTLRVEDNGAGMAEQVLTGPLVDFGRSLWESPSLATEFPGLLASGFRPTGQYGIGFFSTFMLGDRVTVTTRPYRDGEDATQVLEFPEGLDCRPLLRSATESERLQDGGTRVSVALRDAPHSSSGLLGGWNGDGESLERLCAWLCPTLDVTVTVHDSEGTRRAVTARDWLELEPSSLRRRVNGRDPSQPASPFVARLDTNMRSLKDGGGNVVGRGMIVPHRFTYGESRDLYALDGVVSVGGLRATRLQTICGAFVGHSLRAARDVGVPVVDKDELGRWASEQASLLSTFELEAEDSQALASVVAHCGGSTAGLVVGETHRGWVSAEEVREWCLNHDEVVVFQDAALHLLRREEEDDLVLAANVVATDVGWPGILDSQRSPWVDWPEQGDFTVPGRLRGGLDDLVYRLVAEGWEIPLDALISRSSFTDGRESHSAEIGVRAGAPVLGTGVGILRRSPAT